MGYRDMWSLSTGLQGYVESLNMFLGIRLRKNQLDKEMDTGMASGSIPRLRRV